MIFLMSVGVFILLAHVDPDWKRIIWRQLQGVLLFVYLHHLNSHLYNFHVLNLYYILIFYCRNAYDI